MCSTSSNPKDSLILEIQHAAILDKADVAVILRKSKVAAVKLSLPEAETWIDSELDGYNCSYADLPDYRRLHGVLKVRNPYHGLIPVHLLHEETEELLTRTPLYEGIGALQKLVSSGEGGSTFSYTLAGPHRNAILEVLKNRLEPVLQITTGQIDAAIGRVISLILNWTLELEKAGILGEGMSFSMKDKDKAGEITNNIFAQNIGILSSSGEVRSVKFSQTSTGDQVIDQRKLESLLSQAQGAIALLPVEMQEQFSELLQSLATEKGEPSKRKILDSMKAMLEGASGNLAAEGILGLIASIFS